MTRIIIQPRGSLRLLLGEDELEILLESPATLHELQALLLTLFPHIRDAETINRQKPSHPVLRFVVNGEPVEFNRTLSNADVVQVLSAEEFAGDARN